MDVAVSGLVLSVEYASVFEMLVIAGVVPC